MNPQDPFATEAVNFTPKRQGRYVFRRPLAAGGLGVVSIYYDTELNREVALKEIRTERADEPRNRLNFCSEAEVTGLLEHPGVVPIYSMGSGDDGRPYYAMRLITGKELRSYIEQYHKAVKKNEETQVGPQLRQLLSRLIDVCNVMQYAHMRGVLHRDLKSVNVMLGRYGETLVIDWGLAKATGHSDLAGVSVSSSNSAPKEKPVSVSGSNLRDTVEGSAMGTIAYAPPEQLNGRTQEIDARSDIYSLGAILYEILTSEPPCYGMGISRALDAIESRSIPTPIESRSGIPRPLNAIVCKALSPEKEQRYQTAEQLRDDLQAWLDDEPVKAYHEPSWERFCRWRRRHEVFVRFATGALLVVTLISLFAAYRIDVSRQEQQQARKEATELYKLARTATDQLLTRTSDRLSELPDATDIQRGLLMDARASYQRMADVRSGDPELKREAVRSAIGLAKVQRALSEPDDAIISLRSARPTLETLPTVEDKILLARLYIEESRLQGDRGDVVASQSAIALAIPITEQLTRGDTVSTDAFIARGEAMIQRGIVASDNGDFVKAIESFESAVNTLRRLLDRELPTAVQREVRLQLTRAYNNEALQRRNQAQDDRRIVDRYTSALDQADWLSERYPMDPAVSKEHAAVLNNFGNYLLDTKDLDAAESLYQKSAEFFSKLSTDRPTVLEHKERWILALIGLGYVATDRGDHNKTVANFTKAVDLSNQLVSQNQNRISFLRTAAQSHLALGSALIPEDPDRAADLFMRASSVLPKNGLEDVRVFIESMKLDLENELLEPDLLDGLTDRLKKYIETTESFMSADANYNTACLISRCCNEILEQPASSESVDTSAVPEYLATAIKRLKQAIAQKPDYWAYIAEDGDLSILREQHSNAINDFKPSN